MHAGATARLVRIEKQRQTAQIFTFEAKTGEDLRDAVEISPIDEQINIFRRARGARVSLGTPDGSRVAADNGVPNLSRVQGRGDFAKPLLYAFDRHHECPKRTDD